MEIKSKIIKLSYLLMPSILLFFVLTSCSWKYNTLSWFKFWDKEVNNDSLNDKEIAQFISTVRPHQGNPDSHYLLGNYYQERERHGEALREFKKVISIDPYYVKAYNGLAISYDLLGDYSKAVEYYKIALSLNPDLDYIKNNMGYSYLLQGKLDEAIDIFKEILSIDNQNKRALNNLGLAFALYGEFDLAFSIFKIAEDESTAHKNIADLLYKKGLFHEAKEHYTKALALNTSPIDATNIKIGLEAASALSRISEPIANKVEMKDFASLDQYNSKPNMEEVSIAQNKTEAITQHNFKRGIDIEISNGNGVNRMARRLSNHLKQKGFHVVRLTNASSFGIKRTKIYYKIKYYELANDIAQHMPYIHDVEIMRIKEFDRKNIQVKVLIGHDIAQYNKYL